MRETEEMLTKKQEYLEKRIEQEIMVAKKHGTKNKRGMFLNLSEKPVHLFFTAKGTEKLGPHAVSGWILYSKRLYM